MAPTESMSRKPIARKQTIFAPTSHTQTCGRCGGFMVLHYFLDIPVGVGQEQDVAIRCVQCGDVIDRVIYQNRVCHPNLK